MTIKGKIFMGENGVIKVRRGGILKVQSGTLSKRECANIWKGIIVEGQASEEQQTIDDIPLNMSGNGVVYFNKARVEYARNAVSMSPRYIGWPEVKNYWGGYLKAVNSTFINCVRGAEFMSFDFQDKSSFTNCSFSEMEVGISHWNNDGVTYTNCSFENIEKICIGSFDGSINVLEGNKFNLNNHTQSDQAGIRLFQSHSFQASSIIGSQTETSEFIGGFNGIFIEGSQNQAPNLIINNSFEDVKYGVLLQGINHQNISNNSIKNATFGVTAVGIGTSLNNILFNEFDNSKSYGVYSYGENDFTSFFANCFDGSGTKNIFITGDSDVGFFTNGTLMDPQGSAELAASNYFTNAPTSRRGFLLGQQAIPPKYFIKKGVIDADRRVPRQSTFSLYSNADFSSQTDENPIGQCGTINSQSPPSEIVSFNCQIPSELSNLDIHFNQKQQIVDDYIIELGQQAPNSVGYYNIKEVLNEEKICLDESANKLISLLIGNQDYLNLRNTFEHSDFDLKILAYGALVNNKSFDQASVFLQTFDSLNEEQSDFVHTQLINLNTIEENEPKIDEIEVQFLHDAGEKFHFPSSSFARALYFKMTGEIIVFQKSDEQIIQEPVENIAEYNDEKYQISPNPSFGEVTLESINSNALIFEFSSLSGKILFSASLEPYEKRVENLEMLNSGLYLVVIKDRFTNKIVDTKKIFIL